MIGGERRRLLQSLATADDGCTADLLLVLASRPISKRKLRLRGLLV